MEYTIIEGDFMPTVINAVNERLKDGWELSGNLVVVAVNFPTEGTLHYYQAMIRKEVNEFQHG